MRNLKIKDLIDLVIAETPNAEVRIEKIFEWHFERIKITSQWVLGIAATVSAAFLLAFFKAELKINLLQIILRIFNIAAGN